MSNSLWPKGQQHTRPPCPSPSLILPKFKFIASVMLSSHLILWRPLLLLPSIFPSIWDFSNESSIHIRWPKYWSFSFSISPCMNIQGWSPLRLTARFELLAVLAFQESSPAPQFKGINFLAFCLLYGPALTIICDEWWARVLKWLTIPFSRCYIYTKLLEVQVTRTWTRRQVLIQEQNICMWFLNPLSWWKILSLGY